MHGCNSTGFGAGTDRNKSNCIKFCYDQCFDCLAGSLFWLLEPFIHIQRVQPAVPWKKICKVLKFWQSFGYIVQCKVLLWGLWTTLSSFVWGEDARRPYITAMMNSDIMNNKTIKMKLSKIAFCLAYIKNEYLQFAGTPNTRQV